MNACVIFNPAARGDKARKFKSQLGALHLDWTLRATTGPGSARTLASAAVGEGFDTIIAAGGDGTLNEVLNGIAETPDGLRRVCLGVLPLGTINLFARELRIPMELQAACLCLKQECKVPIDLGRADFVKGGSPTVRFFVQVAGAGWDARAVELVSWELKKKVGPLAYIYAGLQALADEQSEIEISDGTTTEHGHLVILGNGKFYGGSFPLLHKSDLQDGILDAVIFKDLNWTSLPGHLLDWATGRIYKDGGSIYMRAPKFTLRSKSRAALQVEGELAGDLPSTVQVLRRALTVLAAPEFLV